MSLPSFSLDRRFKTPRISLLEVRDRLAPEGEPAAAPLATLLVSVPKPSA